MTDRIIDPDRAEIAGRAFDQLDALLRLIERVDADTLAALPGLISRGRALAWAVHCGTFPELATVDEMRAGLEGQ